MKTILHTALRLFLILLITACAPKQSTPTAQPSNPTEAISANTPDTNQLFVQFLSTNQSLIKEQTTVTCQSGYPDLNIVGLELNNPVSYVVDQNPTTVTYKPTVTFKIDDHFSATVKDTGIEISKDGEPVTDLNLITLTLSQAFTIKQVSVSIDLQYQDDVLIKNINCVIN